MIYKKINKKLRRRKMLEFGFWGNAIIEALWEGIAIALLSCISYIKFQRPKIEFKCETTYEIPLIINFVLSIIGIALFLVGTEILIALFTAPAMRFVAEVLRLFFSFAVFFSLMYGLYKQSCAIYNAEYIPPIKYKTSDMLKQNLGVALLSFLIAFVVWEVWLGVTGLSSDILWMNNILGDVNVNSIKIIGYMISTILSIISHTLIYKYFAKNPQRVFVINSIPMRRITIGVSGVVFTIHLIARGMMTAGSLNANYIMAFLGLFLVIFCAVHYVVPSLNKCKECSVWAQNVLPNRQGERLQDNFATWQERRMCEKSIVNKYTNLPDYDLSW